MFWHYLTPPFQGHEHVWTCGIPSVLQSKNGINDNDNDDDDDDDDEEEEEEEFFFDTPFTNNQRYRLY